MVPTIQYHSLMPRRPRVATGGYAYHVLNRAVGRWQIFRKEQDYAAFERVIREVHERRPVRILSYCLMPNHWHFVIWPARDGELSEFMRLLSVTHVQRWHAHYRSAGTGPLYQGRFKSFPVQPDGNLLDVCRYVERNAIVGGLVPRAEQWRWCSAACRETAERPWLLEACQWPVLKPGNWGELLDTPLQTDSQQRITNSLERGRPLGDHNWVVDTAHRLSLGSALNPRGRPRLQPR
jgi:putative transposase